MRRKSYVSKRRHHAKGVTTGNHYKRLALAQDRQHVKFVMDSASQPVTMASVLGPGYFFGVGKIKMNSLELPGNDWSAAGSGALPISYPHDLDDWRLNYQNYLVTSCRLQLWIDPNSFTNVMDDEDKNNVNIVVVPMPWNNTGPTTSSPLASLAQAEAQPYATRHLMNWNSVKTKGVYINRFISPQKLFGEPGGEIGDVAAWGGTLNSPGTHPGNPSRLSHWHVYMSWYDRNVAVVAMSLQIRAKLTMYTTVYGRRTIADPIVALEAKMVGAQAQHAHLEKKEAEMKASLAIQEEEKQLESEFQDMSLDEVLASPAPAPVPVPLPPVPPPNPGLASGGVPRLTLRSPVKRSPAKAAAPMSPDPRRARNSA